MVFNSSTHSTSYIPAYLLYFLSRLAHTVPVWHPLAKLPIFTASITAITGAWWVYIKIIGMIREKRYILIINVIEMWLGSRPANSYERISHLP